MGREVHDNLSKLQGDGKPVALTACSTLPAPRTPPAPHRLLHTAASLRNPSYPAIPPTYRGDASVKSA